MQAYFRGAKAALALGLLPEASDLSDKGLQHDPSNDELRKLKDRAKKLHAEEDARKTKAMEVHTKAEVSSSSFAALSQSVWIYSCSRVSHTMFPNLCGSWI